MKKAIILILTIGIVLRLFLASATFHSDLAALAFAGKIISQGNITNFYDFLWKLPVSSPYLKAYPRDLFNYPPPIYFFYGAYVHLTGWIVSPQLFDNFALDFPLTLGNPQLNVLLLDLKLLFFVFDIGIAWLLMSFVKEERSKVWIFALWIFNPVNLYATYMMGQFDIIPTFFVVAAMYMAMKKERLYIAALLLGIGMSFKIYPLLFIVPLAMIKPKWLDRVKVILVGLIPYVLVILPFISSHNFRITALLAGQATKSLYATLPISGGESIIIYMLAVVFMYIVFMYSRNGLDNLWHKFFILMLLFFIFTHYHPQWFVWITPFFAIDLVRSRFKNWPIIILSLVSWLGLVTFFDPGLTVWLFAPLFPKLWGLPGIWQLIRVNVDINSARSYLQTIFAAAGFYYIYKYFPKKETDI